MIHVPFRATPNTTARMQYENTVGLDSFGLTNYRVYFIADYNGNHRGRKRPLLSDEHEQLLKVERAWSS